MTEQPEQGQVPVDFNVGIIYDPFGDPRLRLEFPPVDGCLFEPEQVRRLGLELIASATRAEAGAQLRRGMETDGVPETIAHHLVGYVIEGARPGGATPATR